MSLSKFMAGEGILKIPYTFPHTEKAARNSFDEITRIVEQALDLQLERYTKHTSCTLFQVSPEHGGCNWHKDTFVSVVGLVGVDSGPDDKVLMDFGGDVVGYTLNPQEMVLYCGKELTHKGVPPEEGMTLLGFWWRLKGEHIEVIDNV